MNIIIDMIFTICDYVVMKPKTWRENHNLSQKELGDMLGFSKSHISMIESGTRFPSNKLISKYYEVTKGKVTANDFFHGGV